MYHTVNGVLLFFCAAETKLVRPTQHAQQRLLTHRNLISQRQRNAPRLAANPHMPRNRPARRPLHAQVRQRVLPKQTPRVHVGRQEVAVARRCAFGREARHVRRLHDVLEVLARVTVAQR